MKQALFFDKIKEDEVNCKLCPHNCHIKTGKRGICRVRKNIDGILYSENYGKVSSLNFDPIEKKPLYHFFPGKTIFSIGSVGCNLSCKFCQNWDIAQASVDDYPNLRTCSVNEIVRIAAQKAENIGIAYTYNEPIVWYEFMLEIAKQAKFERLKNVIVSNGFINKTPLEELVKYIDAFSVDLKAYTETFYRSYTSSQLDPVKSSLKFIQESGRHLEITNLVIPTLNDDEKIFEEMINWIAEELSEDIVLHLSRYFPGHKMNIEATPISKLTHLYKIAAKRLKYVYLGNVGYSSGGNNTFCSNCDKLLIKRQGYFTSITGLDSEGNCRYCGDKTLIIVG